MTTESTIKKTVPARPCINSEADYCRPLCVHYKVRGKRPTNTFIAVFYCYSMKAVHLELISDLSTESFISLLKQFTAPLGRCENIYFNIYTKSFGAKIYLWNYVNQSQVLRR